MKNSKIIQILSTFSQKEISEFTDFVESPFWNPNKPVLNLLKGLLKYYPIFDKNDLQKDKIFKKVFPNRTFDEAYLRKQISIIFQLLKSYLTLKGRNDFDREYALLTQFRERKLDNLFRLQLQNIRKKQTESDRKDSQFFYREFLLGEEADEYFGRQQKRKFDEALQLKTDSLDAFYFTAKLKASCEMLNRSRIIEGQYDLNFIDEITEYLSDENPLGNVLSVKIYLTIFKTLKESENDSHFEKLTELLEKYHGLFSQKEAVGMYRYAQNYCISKINSGQKKYFESLFWLFKNQLKTGINMPGGVLGSDDFKNIVTVGLQLKNYDWVFDFLHEYKPFLSENDRENVFNYNLAIFYYSTQNFEKAIRLLNTVQFTDIYFEIGGRLILLKVYFLENETEALNYSADSFKLNLRRNKKIAPNYRQAIINFLIQLKKLARLKADKSYLKSEVFSSRAAKLKLRIEGLGNILDKRWLLTELEKINGS